MKSLLRGGTGSALLVCAAGIAFPAAILIAVGRNEVHPGDLVHFYGVGFTAVAATVAAVALSVVGARRGEARTVLVGTAFAVMAALPALHGLATPGMLVGWNGLVAFTGGATLVVGAMLLTLAALPGLNRLGIETRILTVCDVYDALLSVRVYRDAWTHAKAMELLHEETGSAFDAACVRALESVLARDASLSLGVAV